MITYGFYNSVDHDRMYDAVQLSSIFDGVINDGVFLSQGNKFAVKAYQGMTLHVDTGKAWFNHTWTVNDTILPIQLDPAESILKRIDTIALEVDASTPVRRNSIIVVKGTPASNPVPAALVNDELKHQYPLARVFVSPGATDITTGDITITVGMDECPFVTGILQTTSVEELYSQWNAQFVAWLDSQKDMFLSWYAEFKKILEGDTVAELNEKIDGVKEKVDNDVTEKLDEMERNLGTQVTYSLVGTTLTITTK